MISRLAYALFSPEGREARAKRRAAMAEEQAKQARIQSEAAYYAGMIPASLARQRIASITRIKGKVIENKVKLRPPGVLHQDYVMLEVDTKRLPHGVTIGKLMDAETINTLSAACRAPVEVRYTPNTGFWYLVPLKEGLGIVPHKIDYDEIIEMMPVRAGNWGIPVGLAENRKLIWKDFRDSPHMMVIGSTGTGKTVWLKNLILTLAMKLPPKRLRFVICDFKRGPDYKAMIELPHLGTPSPVKQNTETVGIYEQDNKVLDEEKTGDYMKRVVIDLDDIKAVLRWAQREIDRRNGLFTQDITNVDQWNRKNFFQPMPHVVIVIDEVAVIMNRLSPKEQGALTILMADIAMLGRSAGIHLVVGLQKLVKRFLDGAISDNMDTRIVGRCASGPQSAMAMGNGSWSANRIPNIAGRAIFRDESTEREIQLPWVSPARSVELVNEITGKWLAQEDNQDEKALQVFTWCLAEQDGLYHVGRVAAYTWQTFRIPKREIEEIKDRYIVQPGLDDPQPIIEIDEQQYVLEPSITDNRPARLVTLKQYHAGQHIYGLPTEDIFRYSLTELDGSLSFRDLYDGLNSQGLTQPQAKQIGQDYEGQTIEIDGQHYTIEPSAGPNPRRLKPCELRVVSNQNGATPPENPASFDEGDPTSAQDDPTLEEFEEDEKMPWEWSDEDDPDDDDDSPGVFIPIFDEENDDDLDGEDIPDWLYTETRLERERGQS